jgi:hypothetical protein
MYRRILLRHEARDESSDRSYVSSQSLATLRHAVTLQVLLLRSFVLSNISKRDTWSTSVVYKDGAEENLVHIFILDSIT